MPEKYVIPFCAPDLARAVFREPSQFAKTLYPSPQFLFAQTTTMPSIGAPSSGGGGGVTGGGCFPPFPGQGSDVGGGKMHGGGKIGGGWGAPQEGQGGPYDVIKIGGYTDF